MTPFSPFGLRASRAGSAAKRLYQKCFKTYPSWNCGKQYTVVLFFLISLMLAGLRLNLHPDPPLLLSGKLVSEEIGPPGAVAPPGYFGRGLRFVLFNSWYGQFNNQILALVNAISIARGVDGVLVLPCEKLGRESIRDSRGIKLRRLFSTRELVGAYFNYSLLAGAVHAVRPSAFLGSADGRALLARRAVVVERKSGGYYRFLLTGRPRGHDPGESGVQVLAPNSTRPRLRGWCDFRAERALTALQKLHRRDRFVFLPVVFRHHNANCSREDPRWVGVRRFLQPRDEFLHAVDGFLATLARPVFAVHLRFFLNGDIGQFTPEAVVQMLFERFAEQMARARTLFVAYTPSSEESVRVVELLRGRFRGRVVGGEHIASFLAPEADYVTQLPLTNVLLDMWVCVRSDYFVGRLGSSMSWNIVYWREALAQDYGLRFLEPLWYALKDFTTTGATRLEG